MQKKQSLTIISTLLLILTSGANAQGQPQLGSITPYDNNYIREVIASYSTKLNSSDSLDQIPKEVLYQTVFRKLQREIHLNSDLLTQRDKAVIMNLPSHNAAQFAIPIRTQQTNMCQSLDIQKAQNNIDTAQLTNAYEDIRQDTNARFSQHYESVLSRLSEGAQGLINRNIEELRGTTKLSYAEIDLAGVATDVPLIANRILEDGCDKLLLESTNDPAPDLLLKDDVYFSSPISYSDVKQ